MTIDPNSSLFKALLSMDAYNRGYNEGIKFQDGLSVVGTGLGAATIKSQSDFEPGSTGVLAGFYAIEYQYVDSNHQMRTVVSYRGTDEIFGTDTANGPVGGDFWNGYFIALGFLGSPQAGLAFDFYNSVVKSLANGGVANPFAADITLTGHSLGGGLAGMVAEVYGKNAAIYDNMPFNSAADAIHKLVTADPNSVVVQAVYGNAANAQPEKTSGITGNFLAGDLLEPLRAAQTPQPTLLNPGLSAGNGVDLSHSAFAAGHFMAPLIIRMFADSGEVNSTAWSTSAKYFWPALFDNTFAAQIGFSGTNSSNSATIAGRFQDTHNYASILQGALAYSVIDSGARPYGDTAIRSFYADANNLGSLLNTYVVQGHNNLSNNLMTQIGSSAAQNGTFTNSSVTKAFIEYAGDLALNKVLQTDHPTATSGVLSFSNAPFNHSFSVNFSDSQWGFTGVAKDNNGAPDIKSRTSMFDNLITQPDVINPSDLTIVQRAMMTNWLSQSASLIKQVVFAASKDGGPSFISDVADGVTSKVSMFIGSKPGVNAAGNDTIFGSTGNDLVLGGGGKGNDSNDSYVANMGGTITATVKTGGANPVVVLTSSDGHVSILDAVKNIYDGLFKSANKIDLSGQHDALFQDLTPAAIHDINTQYSGVNNGTDLLTTAITVDGVTFGNVGTVVGTAQDDTFDLAMVAGRTFDGGGGADTISYARLVNNGDSDPLSTKGVTIDLGLQRAWLTASGVSGSPPASGADTVINIQNVVGTKFDDVIFGNQTIRESSTFFGSSGNDKYTGGIGSNTLDYSTLSKFDAALTTASTGITFNPDGSGGFLIQKGVGAVDGTDKADGSFHNFTGSAGQDIFNISTSGTFAGGDGVDTFNVTGGAVVNIAGDQLDAAGEEYSNTLNLNLGGGVRIDGSNYSSGQTDAFYHGIDNLVVAGSNNTYSELFFKQDSYVRVQLGGSSDTGNAVKNIAFAEVTAGGALLTSGGSEVHGWQSLSNIGALAVKSLGNTYNYSQISTFDYSGYVNPLHITMNSLIGTTTVADGTNVDTLRFGGSWFAGSNKGDTYDLSFASGTPTIWMGSGDNIVNGLHDESLRIVYTGGHDTFNGLFGGTSLGPSNSWNSVILGPGILSPAINPGQLSISVQNVHDGLLDMVLTTGSGSLTFTNLFGTLNPDHTISFHDFPGLSATPRIEFWNDNFHAISLRGFFPATTIQHFHTGVVQVSDLGTMTETNFPNSPPPAPTLTVPGNAPIASGNHIVQGLGAPGEILNGGASDVTLISGNANDYINAQFGNDIIWGGSVSDEIHAGWGNSVIHAGSGGETIYCEYGNQTVYGGSGMDTIIGGRGDDTIFAGTGTNVIWGYQGHNTFVLNATGNTTIMDYKAATDTLKYDPAQVTPDIVKSSRAGIDLVLTLPMDPVTIHGFFANNTGQNQTIDIQFASLGPSGSATYTIDSTGHTLSVVVHGANQPPVAQPDNFSISENAPLTGNVLADNGHGPDTDPNGLALSVVAGTFATAHGGTEVMAANGSFTYTPAAEFHGADSFTYTLQDTAGGTATGTVSIAIAADAPVVQNGQFIMSENGVLTGNVLANNGFGAASDPDGDIAGVQAASLTTVHGASAVIKADGSFTYTPVAGYNGPDSFSYTVLDSQGASASAQINIGITPDAPTAQNETLAFPWGQPVTGNLMANNGSGPASDPDHDVLHVSSASATTANGFAVSFAPDGAFSVAAPNWFVGQDTLSYTVSDPFGQTSTAVATVNIIPPANSLVGTSGNDILHGTADGQFIFSLQGNDTIFAGPGHETIYAGPGTDIIYGGTGPDTMIGSTGNYTYFVNNEHDVVIQNPAGHGTVFTSVDFTVPDNITAMTLTGPEELTATANNLSDVITTNSAEDTLIGGKGTDTFIIHNSEDHINTKAGGTYDVISDVSYELPEGVRSLTLTGNKHLTGTGNDMNNVITANNAGDRIIAGDGNNTIFGGTGNDSISCGDGNNVINGGGGNDRVELGGGSNTVVFKAATAFTGIVTVENFKSGEDDHGHQDQHGHDDNHDHGQNGQNPIDHLDISNLLTAFDPLTEALSQFVHVTRSGHNTVVSVDAQGPAAPNAFVQVATLEHVTGLDLNTMVANGTLIVHS